MKRILLALFVLVVPNISAYTIHNLTSNGGVKIVLYEDFRKPEIALISVIFHASPRCGNRYGILELVGENFISDKTNTELQKLGIPYHVDVDKDYVEISAEMNPKKIQKFFRILYDNDYELTDYEIKKKQIIIDNKVRHYSFEDAVPNEILANIGLYNLIFNEKSLISISQNDIKEIFQQYYKKCPISVIACGAVNYKNFAELLPWKDLPEFKMKKTPTTDRPFREITIESRYLPRSVRYFYEISKEQQGLAKNFFRIFDYEAFKFFDKTKQMISGYSRYVITDNVYQIVFYPKRDVSLDDLQTAYKVFINRLCNKAEFSILEAKLLRSYSDKLLQSSLVNMHSRIKADYLERPESEIKSSEHFRFFCKKNFKLNSIFKIATKYKVSK
ncbi:MAG: hypothetical protein LBF57_02395 [Holosporaceae bacterium]|jgi:hypothetical protein|nr:hypothetical protein [Holosporaceae bacterium]